jgi:Beta-glucosidase-related glycosidases
MNIENLMQELTLEEKASLCSGADFWHTKAVTRLGIPSLMMCDGPNGLRKQNDAADHLGINESISAVCFPTASAVASSFDRDLANQIGLTIGNECRAEKVSMILGPGANIKRSPLCGRNFEYYSEDPYQTSQMATAFIQGVQEKGIGACIKHFAANNQETLRMSGDSILDERTLHEIYLASFESAVKEGKPYGVMCAYNKINGTFAAENKLLLTDVLRDNWGYNGFVVTDWGAIKDRVKGIAAGLDLEMPGSEQSKSNDEKIVHAVKNGELTMNQLDNAVKGILEWIAFAAEPYADEAVFDRALDYKTAVDAAARCAVLLKNENNALPIKHKAKVAFIGGFIEKPRYQGSGSSHINSAYVPSVYDLIQNNAAISYAEGFEVNADELDAKQLEEALATARASEVAIVFAGLPSRYETEGIDRKHIDLPKNQNELIQEICKVQPNTVVVLHNGSPVAMPWIHDVKAVLTVHLGGDGVSEATMALIFGDKNPSGKLAETYPLRLEDNPSFLNFPGENGVAEYHEGVYVGYRYYDKKKMPVLFPFGHGLSYTQFEYCDMTLTKDAMKDSQMLTVSLTVKNTGASFGQEVVQLYIGAPESKVRRPEKELKGFIKVSLQPGESKTVSFELNKRSFAYYEPRIHGWYAETGAYIVSVGSSSRDIRQTAKVQVEASRPLPMVVSKNTTFMELQTHPVTAAIFNAMFGQRNEDSAQSASSMDALGEGGAELAQAMMREMPLGSLVNFGRISEEQLNQMILLMQSKLDEQQNESI